MNAPRFVLALFVSTIALGSWHADAQAFNQRKIVLSEHQFKESYLEKVTVSGGIRAGFMYASPLKQVDVHQLRLYLHRNVEEQDAMLCVHMVSRDGRYAASWQYDLGVQPAGTIHAELPSKYQDQLTSYDPDALVVLAGIAKGDCASQDIKYIPASWGESQPADYFLYVNSGSTDTVIGIPGQTQRIPCTRIAADNTIAYDTRCVIGKEMLADPGSIFLVRSNFGNRLPNVEFPVR